MDRQAQAHGKTDRHTYVRTNRQLNQQINRQKDTDAHSYIRTDRWIDKQENRQTDRQTDRQTQTDKQTNIQLHRQIDTQTHRQGTGRPTDRQACIYYIDRYIQTVVLHLRMTSQDTSPLQTLLRRHPDPPPHSTTHTTLGGVLGQIPHILL